MTGGRILVECLLKAGVKRVYGVVGTSVIDFVNSLYEEKEKIKYISCRHEQTACSMADAEGRLTDKPGIVLTHSGAGTLNIALPVAIASKDCSPVIAITGGKRRKKRGRDGFLEIDHRGVFEKICKDFLYVEKVEDIPQIFSMAYKTSIKEAKGPVMIEIPEDIWMEEKNINSIEIDLTIPSPPIPREEEIRSFYTSLKNSKRPLIVAGGGANSERISSKLINFLEKNSIPLVTTGNGRGCVPENHPLCMGRAGFAGGNPAADYAFKNADFLLLLGCTLSDTLTYEDTWLPSAQNIVMVNADESVLKKKYPVEISTRIHADAFAFVEKISEFPAISPKSEWLEELKIKKREWDEVLKNFASPDKKPVSPALILKKLREMLPEDAIITTGQGTHLLYANYYLTCYKPKTFLSSNNFGAMGFGYPAALSAKLLFPEREVISILGDGDFMMTLQDVETAVREKLDVKAFILNDNSYRVLLATQMMALGISYGTEHTNPDFLKLADAFGAKGFRIEKSEDVEEILREVIREKKPCIVEIPVDKYDFPPVNTEAILGMKRG
jgi:acetolactate synthase-1/2/3 large subunit